MIRKKAILHQAPRGRSHTLLEFHVVKDTKDKRYAAVVLPTGLWQVDGTRHVPALPVTANNALTVSIAAHIMFTAVPVKLAIILRNVFTDTLLLLEYIIQRTILYIMLYATARWAHEVRGVRRIQGEKRMWVCTTAVVILII